MRSVYHLFLSIFLFFLVFVNIGFTIPIEGSGSLNIDKISETYGEELSFDTNEELLEDSELNSAEEKEDSEKTIKELKTNIADLNSDKIHVAKNFDAFILENGDLQKFFKQELNIGELDEIEAIIIDYNLLRFENELLLKDKAVKLEDTNIVTSELLTLKKDLYVSFLPYIEILKLAEYKSFIKADFSATKQDKDIQSDIYKKEKLVEDKKNILQVKIDASDQDLEEKKRRTIYGKISSKLNSYIQGEKFQTLSIDNQKIVLETVLDKVQERRLSIEEKSLGKNDEKLKIYFIVESTILDFITELN